MPSNRNKYSTDRKRRHQIHTNNTKIDTIFRLTLAMERDINKLTTNLESNRVIDQSLHQHYKLDLISNILLELRDKLETYSRTNLQTFNNNSSNNNLNPNTNLNYSIPNIVNPISNANVIQIPNYPNYNPTNTLYYTYQPNRFNPF